MVRRFRRLALTAFATLLLGAPAAVAATLTGTVRDTTGAPVAGAIVRLWQAWPLHGVGTLCPSCYPDCAKSARCGRDGRFALTGLDDSLRFRVLVVAKGRRPTFVGPAVPAAGPVEARLAIANLSAVPDSEVIRGVVRDGRGDPVPGAAITPDGYRMGGLSAYGPFAREPLAVTDDAGRFELVVGVPVIPRLSELARGVPDSAVVWYCRAEARGFAPRMLRDVPAGPGRRSFTLTAGGALSGRVVRDGRPLPGMVLVACQADRRSDQFVGAQSVSTDSAGAFFLGNLPPATACVLAGRMDGFAPYGSAPQLLATTPADDSTLDVGVLSPGPRRRLDGRITFADGTHPPAGTRVSVGRLLAWDSLELRTDAGGRFTFDALPPESLDVATSLRDHHFDPATPGLDPFHPVRVRIADAGDVNLELRMLPGPPVRADRSSRSPADSTRTGAAKR